MKLHHVRQLMKNQQTDGIGMKNFSSTYSALGDYEIKKIFIERDQNDNFKIKFYQEIEPKSFDNKSDLTDKLNKVIEEMIVYRPEGWIWTHDRWK